MAKRSTKLFKIRGTSPIILFVKSYMYNMMLVFGDGAKWGIDGFRLLLGRYF